MKKLSLNTQFRIGAAAILLIACLGVSLRVYQYEKKQVEANIHKEAEIYIAAVEATRTYVKDVLRPQMYEILPEDHFVVEAMSTSFVGREIMGRVARRFRNFRYKRASVVPLNTLNTADELEKKAILRFNADKSLREWSGLIEKDGQSYFTRYRAIYAESECLHCHGRPEAAPTDIIKRYRPAGSGYIGKIGQVIATDAVYIPMNVALTQIKRRAWETFLLGTAILFFVSVLFYALFNRMVTSELHGVLATFKNIGRPHQKGVKSEMSSERLDEIGQIKAAFEKAAGNLEQAHEKLAVSEIKYRRLFENSRDPIFMVDKNLKMIGINAAGIRLFEFADRKEALSIETVDQLFWDARDAVDIRKKLAAHGFVRNNEVPVVNRSGKHIDVLMTVNQRMDDRDRPDGFDVFIRDMTAKKQMEKHLARTERMAAVGHLAAGVAHEINNPLGVIQCYTDLIDKHTGDDPQIEEDISVIRKHTRTCKKIVDGLLNFSRSTEPITARINIHKGITEVLSLLESRLTRQHITVMKEFDENVGMVTADPEKLKQVYLNLMLNAMQAIDKNGRIRITTAAYNKSARIMFHDTGSGISSKNLDRIFDPFFTTKKLGEGTGLGLSISYGIIRDHGGNIIAESMPDKGTIFTIILPGEHPVSGSGT